MFIELAFAAVISQSTVEVQSGDTLSSIGAETGYAWWDIYEANRSTIGDSPHNIRPGMILEIPRHYETSLGVSPSLDTIAVTRGDTLASLAAWAGTDWRTLYDLNRGIIDDPDVIHPGMILRLPYSM
ncbi:MAG: LysM peptidoglycan-binding domain-containing protein [Acidobacteria bacterium]|nr:LysM peptidoglycan-binding domain-containing protein [Acidobacteriota bacterium]